MNRLTVAAVVASSSWLAGCASGEKAPQITPEAVPTAEATTPTPGSLSSENIEQVVRNGLAKYKRAYGCPTDVTVTTGPIPDAAGAGLPPIANKQFVVAAVGSPGEIIINEKFEFSEAEKTGLINVDHVAVHEAVHACIPAPKPLSPVWKPKGEDLTITAIQGLSLLAEEKLEGTNDPILVNEVEEGVAEYLADSLAGPLSVTQEEAVNPPYYRLKYLTRDYLKQGKITNEQLAHYVQTNGLLEFIAKATGVAKPTLDGDVYTFVNSYENAVIGK